MSENKTENLENLTLNDIISAVRKMRTAQKRFRREKNTPNYKEMLEKEQIVDKMLTTKPNFPQNTPKIAKSKVKISNYKREVSQNRRKISDILEFE